MGKGQSRRRRRLTSASRLSWGYQCLPGRSKAPVSGVPDAWASQRVLGFDLCFYPLISYVEPLTPVSLILKV